MASTAGSAYTPHPIDTSHVTLSADLADLLDRLAENVHDVWAQQRMRDGWRYGPHRHDERKEHPGLVPYHELSASEQQYDRLVSVQTIKTILALGYRIERDEDGPSG
jgi:hypothetical protein